MFLFVPDLRGLMFFLVEKSDRIGHQSYRTYVFLNTTKNKIINVRLINTDLFILLLKFSRQSKQNNVVQ